jgi:hypothetical protein
MRRGVREAGNDGSQPGGMSGGDTVPEPTDEMPDGVSDEFEGEDPMDLDLDLDVNEADGEDDESGDPAYGDGPDLEAGSDMREQGDDPDLGGEEPIDYGDDDNDLGFMDEPDDMMDYEPEMGENDEPEGGGGEEYFAAPEERCGMAHEMKSFEQRLHKLMEAPANRSAMKAMFAKAFKGGRGGVPKPEKQGMGAEAFRLKYAKKYGLDSRDAAFKGKRSKGEKKHPGLKWGKKESRAYYLTFTRRLDEHGGPVIGAVRVWFGTTNKPLSYEFYNRAGILESITDRHGRIVHNALAEGRRPGVARREMWEGEDGARYNPHRIIRMGLSEEDLPGRDGADTGVVVKGDEYMGKEGPEYSSVDGMNDPGERGEEGDGLEPGDYDDASSAGGGQVVKSGTWPTSGSPVAMPSEGRIAEQDDDEKDDKDKDDDKDKKDERRISHRSAVTEQDDDKDDKKDDDDDEKDESYVAHLRQKIDFLENEINRYETLSQEQHEMIEALRESARQAEMERARAEAYERHPELRQVESRLLRCESVEDLNTEVAGLISLVESHKAKAPVPAPAPSLVERSGNGAHSGASRDGVPVGSLMESSSPFSDRLSTGARLGNGDVASRVAAYRKRRQG